MAELKNLDLKDLSLPNGEQVTIPVLITLSDEFLEDKTEKKAIRDWKLFNARYSKDKPKENYFAATDFELNSEDVFSNKEHTFVINLDSASAIEQKEIEKLDFGFRILFSDGTLKELGEKQNNHIGKNLNSGLEFHELQELHEQLYNFLNNTVEEFQFKEDAKNRAEIERSKSENEHTNFETEDELIGIEEETVETNDENSELSQEVKENEYHDTNYKEVDNSNDDETGEGVSEYSVENDNTEMVDETEEKDGTADNHFDLENMKEISRKYIEKYVPQADLKTLNTDNEGKSNEKFNELYKTTLEGINSKILSSNEYLSTERERVISHVTRELEKEIVNRYYENYKVLDYKDESNEFNWIYQKLETGYKDVIEDLEPASKERKEFLLREHKKQKEEVKAEAAERAGKEFDLENLPKLDQQVEDEKEQRRNDAAIRYDEEMDQLDEDVDFVLAEKNAKLVDEVLYDFKPLIDNSINDFSNKIELFTSEIENKIEEKWEQFEERVKSIQVKEVESQYQQQSAIDAEVQKRIPQLEDLKKEIETKENEVSALRASLRETKEDSITKEYTISAVTNERKEILDRIDRLMVEKDKAEKDRTEALELYNKHLRENAYPNTAVNQTTSVKEDEHEPWYKKFKDYIVFGGSSIIIATGLIWGSSNMSNAGEAEQQKQKVEQQQKDIESATKEQKEKEDKLKKSQEQQNEKQKELENKQKELDKKSKDKKDDK